MVEFIDMGRVTCEATVENVDDQLRARRGELAADQIRRLVITDALVDSGASTLGLPTSMLRQLGLDTPVRSRRSQNTTGEYQVNVYDPVRLTILGRDIVLEPMEVADGCPVLIGQMPLEHLQLVIDMPNHRIVRSPANGGEWILDMY
ncbi:MAG: hypothetical protein K2X87_12750 [Gemmataceae bacterium]|nr:hypothetical protein [Gemmataceae bacterium]